LLHEFIATHRDQIIMRCRARVATRRQFAHVPAEVDSGVPLFSISQWTSCSRQCEYGRSMVSIL
jgi:hypothetical protein